MEPLANNVTRLHPKPPPLASQEDAQLWGAYSEPCRPLIPTQAGHPFQAMPAAVPRQAGHRSERCRPPTGGRDTG